MKNKGFMLVETLVATTVILGALIFLFIQFAAIKRSYENSFKYNTINGLYNIKALGNLFEQYGYDKIEQALNNSTKGYIKIDDDDNIDACELQYDNKNTAEYKLCNIIRNNIDSSHIIFVGDNITVLQNDLKRNNYDSVLFEPGFRKFILAQEAIEYSNRNRIFVAYKDDTYAAISINKNI